MTSGNDSGEMSSAINVTPMIDILLVLLIIFMVIVPATPKGESALVPRQSTHQAKPNPDSVVLEVLRSKAGDADFRINQQDVPRKDLQNRLTAIFANRAERVLFVKGDEDLSFTQVAEVIDIGHAAGIDHVGLITRNVQLSQ